MAKALTMPAEEAAEMVGCKNNDQFLGEVRDGVWPEALPINCRPKRWSVEALKRKVDELAGLTSTEENPQSWKERLNTGGI